ncbi:YkoF family thiamine/hydroxymethylpyrimidine-binding protein [Arthrobacter sp. ATA002]|uniref:YkoF family thiamine/hydroxymethylpyrimidine-binding protein n=1 Tax=Arthrobacter sp. ATA002 TaxID=2991715 RepID=UPI0022A6B3D4|nr:YkoF family thiamine/hydroxymethylpyrimidine-binding protein [Arthrobacter sp. ATA002]WAP50797.1 YkoF family thiamine/hydroxymethylpyrimidine-binding protein [Arthrobacter sp. ATA002]
MQTTDTTAAAANRPSPGRDETPFTATPREFGVGARLTLAVMADSYADVILEALEQADAAGLLVQTGKVSTYVSGAEQDVLRYLSQVIAAAGRSGAHVSAAVHLSRGCPGGVTCDIPEGGAALYSDIPHVEITGISATADWAIYPLADGGTGSAAADHMRDIYAAIEHAKSTGVTVTEDHYITRLDGDLAQVLQTIAAGWVLVGRSVQHVVTHATLSINSPSAS